MKFTGEPIGISSTRGKKILKVQLSPSVSMDAIDNYSGHLCEFEIGLTADVDGVEYDGVTGEVLDGDWELEDSL